MRHRSFTTDAMPNRFLGIYTQATPGIGQSFRCRLPTSTCRWGGGRSSHPDFDQSFIVAVILRTALRYTHRTWCGKTFATVKKYDARAKGTRPNWKWHMRPTVVELENEPVTWGLWRFFSTFFFFFLGFGPCHMTCLRVFFCARKGAVEYIHIYIH